MQTYQENDLYKRTREIAAHASASEKLISLRADMLRYIHIIDGYASVLKDLELTDLPEVVADFEKCADKIAQANFDMIAILFGYTDGHDRE